MSATYNWAYRPGVTNKYGIIIPAGTDDVQPVGFVYVALFGNDISGNGSRRLPFRTLAKAASLGTTNVTIAGSGVYRENVLIRSLVGDGDVIIDVSFVGGQVIKNDGSGRNLKFIGSGANLIGGNGTGSMIDCIFDNCGPDNFSGMVLSNCIVNNFSGLITIIDSRLVQNSTFYKCRNIAVSNMAMNSNTANIFAFCNISANNVNIGNSFSLYYNCNFKFGSLGSGGGVFPTVPSGYTNYTTISDMQAAFFVAFPSAINPFFKCMYGDPKFNNPAIGDYTLAFDSPAKNLSYFGTYVGAKSIAYPIKSKATESTGSFEFSSAVNITIADDSISLTNPALDAQIDTNVIINTLGRELANFPSYGFNADRNGQYIDSIADLDTVTKSAGDTLSIPAPYLVETGAIVYNGATYQPGERFTTVTGQTTFTTIAAGVVREILEAPQRHTIMARFSDGGAVITAGDALVSSNYYFVQTGSVTYESVLYNAGVAFKAVNTNPFSGTGTVGLAFSTESFQHYEPGIKPTSNNVGDARAGAIVRGNGDPAYVRGGLGVKEFPINAKFIQIRYYIRVSNLKP